MLWGEHACAARYLLKRGEMAYSPVKQYSLCRIRELLGQYDPMAVDNKVTVKADRVEYWIKQGAQASRTVSSLLKKVKPATV